MAGFRKNSRSKAEYARVVKARARALQRDPKDIDPDERRSRERVRARLAEAKPDFAAVLADRELRYIENRKTFRSKAAQAERLAYINDIFSTASEGLSSGEMDMMGFVACVGPTLLMLHQTGGIRNYFSESWHVKMADQAKLWAQQDPARFGAFAAKCEAYQQGERLPYDAHTAALDRIALDMRHWRDIRKPGLSDSEKSAIESQYALDKKDLGEMTSADGLSDEDIDAQYRQISATMVVRDPSYAVMFGVCPGTEEYQGAVEATEAKFGSDGMSSAPESMHAANKDPGWAVGHKIEPQLPRSQTFYDKAMRAGPGAFTSSEAVQAADEATDKSKQFKSGLLPAKMSYWMGRMVSDGFSENGAARSLASAIQERFQSVVDRVKQLQLQQPEAQRAAKTPAAGPAERSGPVNAWDVKASNELARTPDAFRQAAKGTSMIRIGSDVVDLATGETVRGVNLSSGFSGEKRDWAKEGGLMAYVEAVEARMGPKDRLQALAAEAKRAFTKSDSSVTLRDFLSGMKRDQELVIQDSVIQDLKEKGARGLPETLLSGDGRKAMTRSASLEKDDMNLSRTPAFSISDKTEEKEGASRGTAPVIGKPVEKEEAGRDSEAGDSKIIRFSEMASSKAASQEDTKNAASRVLALAEDIEEKSETTAQRSMG